MCGHIKKCTYEDYYDTCMVILAAAYFAIFSTENMLKGYTPGNLIFGQDLNITIKNNSIWGLIQY